MRVHVEALFTTDGRGRLVAVNDAGGGPAPRVVLGHTPARSRCWFRHDLDEALIHELMERARSVAPNAHPGEDPDSTAPLVERLEAAAPVEKVWAGPAFCFPRYLPGDGGTVSIGPDNAPLLRPHFTTWLADARAGVPFTAVLDGDRAASICCSVRVTADAHEAGVETHPAFRGRGFAARAVAAWARVVRTGGRVPLYSTSWQNLASRSVAKQLGLVQFGADLHLT